MKMNASTSGRLAPWNKGKVMGQKAPLKLKDIWTIRVHLQMAQRVRELALFNLALDSKLRGCDLVFQPPRRPARRTGSGRADRTEHRVRLRALMAVPRASSRHGTRNTGWPLRARGCGIACRSCQRNNTSG